MSPDRLDPAAVERVLAARPGPRWRVNVVPETASTNADVAAAARAGAPEGLVVVAEHQRAGRGRLGRTWVAPSGTALTFSLLLRPVAVPAARWSWLPLAAGLVVRGALADCGVDASLKWPNDVRVAGRKVAGVLVERVDTPGGAAAVVGIGVNVTQATEQLATPEATSLRLVGAGVSRAELLAGLLSRMAEADAGWRQRGGRPDTATRLAYEHACDTLGREVEVRLPDHTAVTGMASGVDDGGRLLLRTTNGTMVLAAGEVIHLRASS